MQGAQFVAHDLPEFGVERAQRLIHQERLRLAHDRAPERDALPVAAGEARHRLVDQTVDAQQLGGCLARGGSARRASMPWHLSGKAMFCRTVICG